MKPLQSISIRSRLRLALALIALFFMLFCAFSIYQINKIGSLVSELHDKPINVMNASMKAYMAFAKTGIL